MNIKLIVMMETVRSFFKREEGASAIEYALIAGLIAVVIIAAVTALGTELQEIFEAISEKLEPVSRPTPPPAG